MQVDQGQVQLPICATLTNVNTERCCITRGKQLLKHGIIRTSCTMPSLLKSGDRFWKCWNSKFKKEVKSPKLINGLTEDQIAEAFADFSSKTCTSVNDNQSSRLQRIYHDMLDMYKFHVDVELIESVTSKMKRVKAAGLDELTIEHVVNSHPVLIAILAELFNLVMFAGHIPHGFRLSYTVTL